MNCNNPGQENYNPGLNYAGSTVNDVNVIDKSINYISTLGM